MSYTTAGPKIMTLHMYPPAYRHPAYPRVDVTSPALIAAHARTSYRSWRRQGLDPYAARAATFGSLVCAGAVVAHRQAVAA